MRTEEVEVTLNRDLSLFDVTMIGVGAMIGAGIFVLTGVAAGAAGPALVLAFFLNGLVATLTAMAYAELGSAFPEAGGGYLWVKEALGDTQGFLGGWMSWFAHSVAGSLYALAFGSFVTEFYLLLGLPDWGIGASGLKLIFMSLIIIALTYLNFRGASETGVVGNIVTVTKIIILGIFCIFGLVTMFQTPENWMSRFSEDFLPNGFTGVLIAMGLTFIAFEGYEIIAQSGEEIKNPKQNLPRAIFISIAVVVVIYILVAFVAIGAITPAGSVPAYQFLGEKGEVAIVEAATQIMPYGGIVLLISAIASTMSALIATTYSSSRVSFAMGRDINLPKIFSRIHPTRHTPYGAIVISGLLIGVMAWILPIEDVAAAADLMFLFLFIQVNISVMRLRLRRPELDRGFVTPLFPIIPVLAIVIMIALAIFLFLFSPVGWYVGLGWIVAGMLFYWGYFSKVERREKPREILLEEVLVKKKHSVLVPVATQGQAKLLGRIGAILAKGQDGELLALNIARVPPQLKLIDGRTFLREGKPSLEAVIMEGRQLDVPVHTMIRLSRDVAKAIRKTVEENHTDLIVLGWPGTTDSSDRVFGSVIDDIVDNPPADVAIVHHRTNDPIKSILVPVAGGPNSRLAVRVAIVLSRNLDQNVKVTALNIVSPTIDDAGRVQIEASLRRSLGKISQEIDYEIVEGEDVVKTILDQSQKHDMIVIGATNEPLFRNILVGNIPEQVARQACVSTVMVKRHQGPLRAFLRETVLMPSTGGRPSRNDGQPHEK